MDAEQTRLRERLEQVAHEKGAPVVGVAAATPWAARPGHAPRELLPSCERVIVLGAPFPRTIELERPFRAGHKAEALKSQILNQAAYFVAQELEEHCWKAVLVPTADFADGPEKLAVDPSYAETMTGDLALRYAAVKSGVAVIGKSGMALHPRYGPFIGFAAVLTNAVLPCNPILEADLCGECTACIAACYTGALGRNGTYDPIVCNTNPKGKVRLVDVGHVVCPAPCRNVCPVGVSKTLNLGARLQGADPFQHAPYNSFHQVPPHKR